MRETIYIADDEKNIRDLIESFLKSDGYHVVSFENGDQLYEAFIKTPSDLVILDIMMPGRDGLEICRLLRERTSVPIILLTAKDTEVDYIRGFSIGSDDYITKPFRPTFLLMKVNSLLRRIEMDTKVQNPVTQTISFSDLTYHAEKNMIFCNGKEIPFTQTELKLMVYLLKTPEKSFSREELLNAIWGYETEVETRVTDETLRRIRKKLTEAKSNVKIKTVWGYGYKLELSGEK